MTEPPADRLRMASDGEPPTTPVYRWSVLVIIMLGTFMAILDSSIVNVALPHMMSAFGVTRDRIEWVATGFMLASATVMPLVGWMSGRMSYKTLYLSSLLIFTAASGMCAFAWSLESLIAARIIQAIGAGAIQPIGMAIVAELFEPHERGKALGVWGTGIMVGPALGPTLGGYLTDAFGWRSIFSVNLPIGVITLVMGLLVMSGLRAKGRTKSLDVVGYAFLAMAIIAGLTALSNGQEKGWSSDYIRICIVLATIGAIMFVTLQTVVKHPLLDLKLFAIRNYSLAIILAIFRSIGLFGSIFLFPIFLQTLMGFTTVQAGIWMIPGALAVGVTMPVAGRLADKYAPSYLVALGCLICGISLILFGRLDPMSSWQVIVLPQLMRGCGLALMMSPLLTAALNSVPQIEIPMASSFLNVSQNIGGAMGIAVMNTFVTNSIHQHAVRLGEALPLQSQSFMRLAGNVSDMVVRQSHGVLVDVQTKAVFAAAMGIERRAQVLGFNNAFTLAGIIVLAAVPLCLLLKPLPHHHASWRGGEAAPNDDGRNAPVPGTISVEGQDVSRRKSQASAV